MLFVFARVDKRVKYFFMLKIPTLLRCDLLWILIFRLNSPGLRQVESQSFDMIYAGVLIIKTTNLIPYHTPMPKDYSSIAIVRIYLATELTIYPHLLKGNPGSKQVGRQAGRQTDGRLQR